MASTTMFANAVSSAASAMKPLRAQQQQRTSAFASGKAIKALRSRAAAGARSADRIDVGISAVATDAPAAAAAASPVERGSGWEVHKFGGTCVVGALHPLTLPDPQLTGA